MGGGGLSLFVFVVGWTVYGICYWLRYTFGWQSADGNRTYRERNVQVCSNLMSGYCPASVVVSDEVLTLWLGYHWREESEGRSGPSFGMFYEYRLREVVATVEDHVSGRQGVVVTVPGGTLGTVRNWLLLSIEPHALASAISARKGSFPAHP